MRILQTILFMVLIYPVVSQNTIGLLSYDANQAFDGYNLMFPHNQPNVYLLDNCGEIVNVWEDDVDWRPGNTAYLTEEGLLYKAKRNANITSDPIWAGGGGAILEIRDWDNNLIWDFEMNDSINRLHHDFSITEKGNIIAIAWELKTTEDCIAAGRDTSTLAQNVLWPDWVFEIDPKTDEIVWEWHTWDHLIQDFDATKANFGVVADHPELININYGRPDGHPDWMHANALDYNDDRGQVMLSVPYFDEIWIIDQTTTTEQAATGDGGFSGIGGDLMYRWGNPQTYDQGDSTDQKSFFQHDAHWVDDFLSPAHPLFGKIAFFNNRFGSDFSVANVIEPAWDMYNWKYEKQNGDFQPETYTETYDHPNPTQLYSTGLSSIQILPNGNQLITGGRFGYTFELTQNDEIVWEYKTPIIGGAQATQGDSLTINNNLTFRMKRYPVDFKGFDGKDLTQKGWIELSPNEEYCDQLTDVIDPMNPDQFTIYPNPAHQKLVIEWDGMKEVQIDVFDIHGRLLQSMMGYGGRKYLDLADWKSGIHLISFTYDDNRYTRRIVVE